MPYNNRKRMAWSIGGSMALLLVCLIAFFGFYRHYMDDILYKERLNQMEEVTKQLFSGLNDVVESRLLEARAEGKALRRGAPDTLDELYAFMQEQSRIGEMEERQAHPIAVDSTGKYYMDIGPCGLLRDVGYLEDNPAQVNYVTNTMTTKESNMVCLYRLDEPITVHNANGGAVNIIYYGIMQRMEQLNKYLDCDAYDDNNVVYIIDNDGLKLLNSDRTELIQGYNVYSALLNMDYLHGNSFDQTLEKLKSTGSAYSNVVLNGVEYYYGLKKLDYAEWTVLFLVPSEYVATNTVWLVNIVTWIILIFALVMADVMVAVMFILLRAQQKSAIALERSNSENLAQINEKLAQAVQAADHANRAKTEFLANMSHDIRTPMNAIVGITHLMEHERDDPEKMKSYIRKVQASSSHLLGLINDILDMSRIESGEVKLNREPINMAEQVAQVDSIVRTYAQERSQTFTIRVNEVSHEMLICDSVRLRQVFINLLSNAVKYTPNGGRIELGITELPGDAPGWVKFHIAVSDNGYGMTPEFVKHIFEPFTRMENSTTNKIQGTGLGMAITRNIVDMNGGSISVKSELGKGSTFDLILRFAINPNANYETSIGSVLLITAEEQLARNVRAAFKESGVCLKTVDTLAAAYAALDGCDPDAILLCGFEGDGELPGAVAELRRRAAHAPLIFCCGYIDSENMRDIFARSGADGVIARPFFFTNFARMVDQALCEFKPSNAEDAECIKGMRFLCAEDNSMNAEILEALMDMHGASCVIYKNGAELVDAFMGVKPGDYDAILMDVQMPVMNGLEATMALRSGANPLGRTIPIIAMTANAFSTDVQMCLDAGMDAHIAKPLDIELLERTLKNILAAKNSGGVKKHTINKRRALAAPRAAQ